MEAIGKELLETKTCLKLDEAAIGFHWPIVSVNHLHLHVIAPKQDMNCFKRLEFHPWTFGSVEMALAMMESKAEDHKDK